MPKRVKETFAGKRWVDGKAEFEATEHYVDEDNTRKAAEELLKRFVLMFFPGKPPLKFTVVAYRLGALHGFCTVRDICRKYGITKQDFQQLQKRLVRQLGLRKTHLERTEGGRENMRNSNHRQCRVKL